MDQTPARRDKEGTLRKYHSESSSPSHSKRCSFPQFSNHHAVAKFTLHSFSPFSLQIITLDQDSAEQPEDDLLLDHETLDNILLDNGKLDCKNKFALKQTQAHMQNCKTVFIVSSSNINHDCSRPIHMYLTNIASLSFFFSQKTEEAWKELEQRNEALQNTSIHASTLPADNPENKDKEQERYIHDYFFNFSSA